MSSILKEDFNAFDRPEDARCSVSGCTKTPYLYWRDDAKQWYWHCPGNPSLGPNEEGHRTQKRQVITKGSLFYRKKMYLQYMMSAIYQIFQGRNISDMLRDHNICSNSLSQLMHDCQMLMLSDYKIYNLGEEYLLGSNPYCHHIQIDESKLGKRKFNRGRHVEGIWVLGMVEALIPENPNHRTYQYTDVVTGITETRYHFEAGNRVFITVPNRTAATLLPIIYRFCKPQTVIRSDGWRAYRALHSTYVDDGQLDFDTEDNQLFFRAHQVVNHSQGFTTVDQVTSNPEVSLTPVSGHLHTNIIESLWRDLKLYISPRYRNANDCPGKILEYLWRFANKGAYIEGMKRCIREVEFVAGEFVPRSATNSEAPLFFTAGQDGESSDAQARRLRRDEQRFEQWIGRRRERDEDAAVLSETDGDNDDDHSDLDYLPARARPIRTSSQVESDEQSSQAEPSSVRHSERIVNSTQGDSVARGGSVTRRPVGRPPRVLSETVPRVTSRRGRPSRGSRGRGRPRSSGRR